MKIKTPDKELNKNIEDAKKVGKIVDYTVTYDKNEVADIKITNNVKLTQEEKKILEQTVQSRFSINKMLLGNLKGKKIKSELIIMPTINLDKK